MREMEFHYGINWCVMQQNNAWPKKDFPQRQQYLWTSWFTSSAYITFISCRAKLGTFMLLSESPLLFEWCQQQGRLLLFLSYLEAFFNPGLTFQIYILKRLFCLCFRVSFILCVKESCFVFPGGIEISKKSFLVKERNYAIQDPRMDGWELRGSSLVGIYYMPSTKCKKDDEFLIAFCKSLGG